MPGGTSITRFSTSPVSVTMTASARPWLRLTNSTWRQGTSALGASTSPAQPERPESASVVSVSISSTVRPAARHLPSMLARSSSVSRPSSSRPST